MSGPPHARTTWLRLAGLAVLGICVVSIPVTITIVLSAKSTSDRLAVGPPPSSSSPTRHASPAAAIARIRCRPRRGWYALTFDDGPFPATTRRLVAALRRARAVATFFDVGRQALARPELVELQRSAGQVANHSYSHPHLPRVSSARRVQELQAAASALDHPNALFRPPYGDTDAATDEDIRRSGLVPVYWTVDAGDAHGGSSRTIARRAMAVRPGGIVLLHDGVAASRRAVAEIVAGLRRRGMCPGLLAQTRRAVLAAGGQRFHVTAVRP